MAIDAKSLTIDSKSLLKAASTAPPDEKVSASAILSSMTPTQYAQMFPQQRKQALEREAAANGQVTGRAVSGGVPGTTESNPGPVGGGGGARSAIPQGRTGRGGPSSPDAEPQKPTAQPWHSQLRKDREQASGVGLQAIRSRQMKELEDPKVRAAVLARAELEVGAQPQAQQAWLESVFNRASANKLSLYDAVSNRRNANGEKHRYYPIKDDARWGRMSAEGTNKALEEKFGGHLNAVGGGSNITDYATDNSSLDLADR